MAAPVTPALTFIFQASLNQGQTPEDWKLAHYGVRGPTLNWIKSFLAGRTQRVIVEGVTSDPAPVTSGVPQGTVLEPLLFLIYTNEVK
jgi:hypothetical protein